MVRNNCVIKYVSSSICYHIPQQTVDLHHTENGFVTYPDIALAAENYGWKFVLVKGEMVLLPQWDSIDNISKMNALKKEILQKCGCKRSQCRTRACSCIRRETECTKLCTCIDCKNDIPFQRAKSKHEHDTVDEEETYEGEDEEADEEEGNDEENDKDAEEEEEEDQYEEEDNNDDNDELPDGDEITLEILFLDEDELGDEFITFAREFDCEDFDYVC